MFSFCVLMRKKVENPGVDLWHYSGTSLKVSLKSIRHRFGRLSMKIQLNNVWPLLTGRMRTCCSVQFSFLFMATKPFTNSSTYSLSIRAFSAAEWWRFFDFFCPQTSWGFFQSFNRRAQSWSAHSLMTSQVTLHSKTSLLHMASMWLTPGHWWFSNVHIAAGDVIINDSFEIHKSKHAYIYHLL